MSLPRPPDPPPPLPPLGGDDEKDFDIQRNTGTISIARRLDAARRSNYNMTVRVTNGHNSATTQVSSGKVYTQIITRFMIDTLV